MMSGLGQQKALLYIIRKQDESLLPIARFNNNEPARERVRSWYFNVELENTHCTHTHIRQMYPNRRKF